MRKAALIIAQQNHAWPFQFDHARLAQRLAQHRGNTPVSYIALQYGFDKLFRLGSATFNRPSARYIICHTDGGRWQRRYRCSIDIYH